MYRKFSYDECIAFIQKRRDINLLDFQKEMLKAFCEGKEVRSSRCAGRSLVAKAFGEYVAHVYDKNNYEVEPEITISCDEVVDAGLLSEDYINKMEKICSEEQFAREFCKRS